MRICVFLLPNSMPLTVHLCLLVATCVLIILLCSRSCLGSQYQDCMSDKFACAGVEFSYPFGKNGSGCGDPEFQLVGCDDQSGHPLLNISGEEYRILDLFHLDLFYWERRMIIVNDNLFGSKCNLSGYNYSQFWWPGSHFQISAEAYTNITLSTQCDPKAQLTHLPLCGNDWYYNIQKPEEGARFCETYLQIPIKKEDLPFNGSIIDPNFLRHGLEIEWHPDQKRDLSCGDCSKSKGRCGYAISESTTFICHCPDGTSHPYKCPEWHPDQKRDLSCGDCWKSKGRCGDAISESTTFICHCPDGTSHPDKCPGGKNKSAIIIGCSVGGAVLAVIAVVLFLTYCAKRRKPSPSQDPANNCSKYEMKDMEACAPRLNIGNLSIFSYDELREATNCFHEDNELGDGGFGSVYLGKLREGRIVAVKRLYQGNSRTLGQFINEVAIFSSLKHPHIVRLYGCTSADSPQLLLVYEFVPNGTLENHLHGDRKGPGGLPWNTRLNIAIQTAQALNFLHSFNPPIFHRDVKSSNILLGENFGVKLADFGLCRHVPVNASHVTTTPQGTPGYVDPEYHQYYQLTEKSDVYSFGVVLVEIISAKLAVDTNRNSGDINLAKMAISKIQEGALHELVDPQLEMEMNDEVKVTVNAVAELAFRCLAAESDDRPHMNEVVALLEEIRGLWGVCPPSPDEESVSFPDHKHWRSFPTSMQDKRPIMSSAPNVSA